jgi:hypothetical protein
MTYVIWLCAPRGWMAPLAFCAKPGSRRARPETAARAGDRQPLDARDAHGVPGAGRGVVHGGLFGPHDDGVGHRRDREAQRNLHGRSGGGDHALRGRREAVERDREVVGADGQVGQLEATARVGHGNPFQAARGLAQGHRGAGYGGVLRVHDHAADDGGDLGIHAGGQKARTERHEKHPLNLPACASKDGVGQTAILSHQNCCNDTAKSRRPSRPRRRPARGRQSVMTWSGGAPLRAA